MPMEVELDKLRRCHRAQALPPCRLPRRSMSLREYLQSAHAQCSIGFSYIQLGTILR
jgi:hypothetical protein